jgi:hypothetical protein
MRATSMRRLIGAAAALFLIGSTLIASTGGVVAGDTRILDIHSPGEAFGVLSFTQVGPGGVTKTDVVVTNKGKQNLTKAHLLIGAPDGVDLPAGISVADVFGLQGAGTCTKTASTVDCDFGSLTSKGAGATRTVSIAFNVGAASPASAITVTIKVAENVQDVGSNVNFRQASGIPTVDGASCHGYATYILSVHDALDLAGTSTDCAGQDQVSSLGLQENSGNGFAKFDDLTPAVCTISGGLTCFGNEVNATVHNGDTILPYLTWKITYSATLLGNINASKVAFQHGTATPITFKKNTCGAPEDFTSDCIVKFTPNSDGSVTFEIRTKTNSTIRGVH